MIEQEYNPLFSEEFIKQWIIDNPSCLEGWPKKKSTKEQREKSNAKRREKCDICHKPRRNWLLKKPLIIKDEVDGDFYPKRLYWKEYAIAIGIDESIFENYWQGTKKPYKDFGYKKIKTHYRVCSSDCAEKAKKILINSIKKEVLRWKENELIREANKQKRKSTNNKFIFINQMSVLGKVLTELKL